MECGTVNIDAVANLMSPGTHIPTQAGSSDAVHKCNRIARLRVNTLEKPSSDLDFRRD